MLNFEAEKEFALKMKNCLVDAIENEKTTFSKHLPREQIVEMINEKFNLVQDQEMIDFGNLSEGELIQFCNKALFAGWERDIKQSIYP